MTTTRELAEAAQASGDLCKTFDYALPQDWWDNFHNFFGKPPLAIVWAYPEKSIWGIPWGLTPEAKADIALLEEKRRSGDIR